jgi:hypothetical protein
MTLRAVTTLFAGDHLSGAGWVLGLGDSDRYNRVSQADLIGSGLAYDVSSARLITTDSRGAVLALFNGYLRPYGGNFVQVAVNADKTDTSILDLGPYSFNDQTTSALLIHTGMGPEKALSFRDVFLDKWLAMIDDKLVGSKATREFEPVLTWEMFPETLPPLSSNLTYLKVYQALKVNPFLHYVYDAAITYHLYLYVDPEKHIKGLVRRRSLYVSGGYYHDAIVDDLYPRVEAGAAQLNAELATELGKFSGLALADCYYLPGRHTIPLAGGAVVTGHTDNDVTIVLQTL